MRILQVCHKPPRPAVDGGCIAMDNLTKGFFEEGHEISVLCASTDRHPYRAQSISDIYHRVTGIEAVYVDTRSNFVDAFSNLITRDNFKVSKYFSPDFDMALERKLVSQEFDIIQLESLFMTPYIATIRRFSKAKVVLRSHNLEYKIWHRSALVLTSSPRKAYFKLLAKRLKEYESSIIHQVDGIATISSMDTESYLSLGCTKPICTIPFGLDTTKYDTDRVFHFSPSLFHLGALDWNPNAEGLTWFIKEAWPKVLKAFPKFKLHIAGKAASQFKVAEDVSGVVVEGEVGDAQTFMKRQGIMIVPLFSGSGIRVKIIEAMALGKLVISTPTGAEGLDLTHLENILIAKDEDEFVAALQWIHDNPDGAERIIRNARKMVEQRFDHLVITRELLDFYNKLLQARPKLAPK